MSTAPARVPALHDPSLYTNRELSWLEFNQRVLDQATSDYHPLLERVKFLAIVGSNLDQFFMVRAHLFRIIRDTDMEIREEVSGDLLESVDRGLKEQRSAAPSLLQVEASMPRRVVKILIENIVLEAYLRDTDRAYLLQGVRYEAALTSDDNKLSAQQELLDWYTSRPREDDDDMDDDTLV